MSSSLKVKRNKPRGPKIDMSNTLATNPIFLCLMCLVGFCFVVTLVLVEMPQHDTVAGNGPLKDLLSNKRKSTLLKLRDRVIGGKRSDYYQQQQQQEDHPADNAIEFHHIKDSFNEDISPDNRPQINEIPKNQQQQNQQLEDMEQPHDEMMQQEGGVNNNNNNNKVDDIIATTSKKEEVEIPFLPVFASIPNHSKQKEDTLNGHPTIAGVAANIIDFLNALHNANKENSNNKAELPEILDTYFKLALEYIKPLEDAYHGQPIFPVRDDDSIFISLAAFREHLLAQTLRSAFSQAEYPDKIYVGVIVQNCFGLDGYQCRTGMQVYGKDEKGRDKAKISDAPPDINGIEEFCTSTEYRKYCLNNQVRVIYQHETDALGPAIARYYASKLWGGETYFMQMDSHLEFAKHWDTFYIKEVKLTKSYPNSVLSTYPPGFQDFGNYSGGTKGSKLCFCEFSTNEVERHIIRINTHGVYKGDEVRPKQIAYIAAGFFFAHAHFLKDVPFDPYLPWCFMGEEIALSMRAWTAGWDIYAPRTNMIAHQYRPGRMGLPKFWESVGRDSSRPNLNTRLQAHVLRRVKHMVGYTTDTKELIEKEGDGIALTEYEHYSLGTKRTREAFLELTKIDPIEQKCHPIPWCTQGTME